MYTFRFILNSFNHKKKSKYGLTWPMTWVQRTELDFMCQALICIFLHPVLLLLFFLSIFNPKIISLIVKVLTNAWIKAWFLSFSLSPSLFFLKTSWFQIQLPEKVNFAIELSVSGEALLGEVAVALTALDALGVPGSVQHVEEEPVQDGPFAPGTLDHHIAGLQDAECRPTHADCAARTWALRVYAEQRLGSERCAVRRKLEGPVVQRQRSDNPRELL